MFFLVGGYLTRSGCVLKHNSTHFSHFCPFLPISVNFYPFLPNSTQLHTILPNSIHNYTEFYDTSRDPTICIKMVCFAIMYICYLIEVSMFRLVLVNGFSTSKNKTETNKQTNLNEKLSNWYSILELPILQYVMTSYLIWNCVELWIEISIELGIEMGRNG